MQIEKIVRKGYSSELSNEQLWEIYKSMKTQRLLEDRLLKMYKGGQLSGAVYPGIGQEASMAGIGRAMITEQNQGLVKVYSEKEGPIVGASICGPSAGEMIHEIMYWLAGKLCQKRQRNLFMHIQH